jgi:hypothetical protein
MSDPLLADHTRLFEFSVLQRLVACKPQRDALEDVPERAVIG